LIENSYFVGRISPSLVLITRTFHAAGIVVVVVAGTVDGVEDPSSVVFAWQSST
jgi:hypothetical protein